MAYLFELPLNNLRYKKEYRNCRLLKSIETDEEINILLEWSWTKSDLGCKTIAICKACSGNMM